ncbi:methyltransferase domain-containing protein [bacterium]|nr:methyltransferase domain-containing protein [bacterium]
MNTSVFHRDNCRLCGGHNLELVLQLAPAPIADDYVSAARVGEVQETYPLDLYLCRTCGHAQLLNVVNPEVLFGEYVYLTSVSIGLVEHFRRYADALMCRVNLPQGAFVVDIGSNDGSLLRFFQERGMRVLGIDPAREIARQATESGIETLPTYFTSELACKIKQKYGPAAIVTANNVFAHIDNLGDVVEGVRELLASDGVFVFEVSYLVDIIQKTLFDTIYHEHLCYHAVKPLNSFFSRHGMQFIDVQRIPTKGGSLHGTVQLSGGSRPVSPSVGELIALESSLGLDCPEPFKTLATKLDRLKAQLLNLLSDLKSQGKTIAGYGASATVTTLIYHFGIGDMLNFIVDDNPRKQGTFSPGYHIPVLHPRAIYEQKADYVLILAWNYVEPIMKKHEFFLKKGGHFIIPMPKVQLI